MRQPTWEARVRSRARSYWHNRILRRWALTALVWRTRNFVDVRWMGEPIWQNPLDAWLLQETIVADEVDLVIECGTNRGGSALFMASIFDLLGRGRVITIDVEQLSKIEHPRIEYVIGSSVDEETAAHIRERVRELKPSRVMVMLDSDHSGPHVLRELELYAPLVPIGGHLLVQDGCIDELRIMRKARPGPLWAVRRFLAQDNRFRVDEERSGRFLLSHSPSGWLERVS